MTDFNFEFHYFSRYDTTNEPISKVKAHTRYQAALFFAKIKKLSLKSFLKLYAVSR